VKKTPKPAPPQLTLGPLLFHWPVAQWQDFYSRIADEAPVDTVYLGEPVCAKRAPFYEHLYAETAERLQRAGKKTVFSTLAEVAVRLDRKTVESVCAMEGFMIEANDAAALWHLSGKPHAIGQMMNVYSEDTLRFLARNGARHFCLPAELPAEAIAVLGKAARKLGVTLETQVYGRIPLALSARCYHARAHGRTKDSCQFVCGEDPDGMELRTLEGKPFLAVNGVQTLSHNCLNLIQELDCLVSMNISAFRLSPHSHDMTAIARIFRETLDSKLTPGEAIARLSENSLPVPFCNGFYHKENGYQWIPAHGKKIRR